MVEINRSLCIGCSACIKDCPASRIRLKEGKAIVKPGCIQCGHCVAICPVEAVSIPAFDMADVVEYNEKDFTINPVNLLNSIKFRRSIRTYKNRRFERKDIEEILMAGRYTPTGKNVQDVTFIFLQDALAAFKETFWSEAGHFIPEVAKHDARMGRAFQYFYTKWEKDPKDDTFFFNAPAVLVITSANLLDGGLAAANIERMAVAKGAGVLYSGYIQAVLEVEDVLRDWLETGDKKIAAVLLMGYPAYSYQRTAPRKPANIIMR